MKPLLHIFASLSCFLLALSSFGTGVVGKSYLLGARANLSCRFNHQDSDLSNDATLQVIDKMIDELYDPKVSLIKMNANYSDACNDTIEFDFEFEVLVSDKPKVENDSSTKCMNPMPNQPTTSCTKLVKVQLVNLLESFEIQRDRYAKGLWGYCAHEGAEELMKNITQVLKSAQSSNNIVMCNRSELLMCHPRYKKCQCIVDNKNFREVASEYWNDTEEMADSSVTIGRNQCVLNIGSDCPLGDDSGFMCIPKSMCLFKSNRSRKTPCNTLHKNAMDISDPNGRTQSVYDLRALHTSELEGAENDTASSVTSNSVSGEEDGLVRLKQILSDYDAYTKGGAFAANARMKNAVRDKRIDYFSNVHCQCYGFVGGKTNMLSKGLSSKRLETNMIYLFLAVGLALKLLYCNLML